MTETAKFDAFLSHNSREKPYVEEIATWLQKQNIRIWYDKWELRPGIPWQKELEQGILKSIAIVVFFGKSGFGTWHEPEMRAALSESMTRGCPVIPVLLPGCAEDFEIPLFLKDRTWVDFRSGLDGEEAKGKLLWGITGHNPYAGIGSREQKTIQPISPSSTLRDQIMEGKNRRRKRKLEGLEKQTEMLSEKIEYLKACYIDEAQGEHKYALKKQIEKHETELGEIEDKIDELYQQIEG